MASTKLMCDASYHLLHLWSAPRHAIKIVLHADAEFIKRTIRTNCRYTYTTTTAIQTKQWQTYYWMRLFESDRSRTIPSGIGQFFSTNERLASRFFKLQMRSVRPLWLWSDQNVRQNWAACRADLFTVFMQLKTEWEFCGKACISIVFLSDLVLFIKLSLLW